MFHNLYEVSSTRMPFLHRKIEPNSYFKAKVKFEYLSLSLLTTWSLINFLKILYFFCMYSVPVKIQSFIVRVLVIDLCMSTVVSSCICSHILSEMQSTKKKAEWEVEQPGFNPVSMWVEDTDIARTLENSLIQMALRMEFFQGWHNENALVLNRQKPKKKLVRGQTIHVQDL